MICPHCGRHNLTGAETCESCHAELAGPVSPHAPRNLLEAGIERDTVAVLRPARPVTAEPAARVREVVGLLAAHNIGCVLITFADTLVGIFSERDVLMRIGDRYAEVADEPIRHFMTPAPETLTMQDSLAFVLNRMAVGDYRHVPIEDQEKPVGIISARDMIAYATRRFPEILRGES